MANEASIKVVAELAVLLADAGYDEGSPSQQSLVALQRALRGDSDVVEYSDYTKSRAQALRSMALHLQSLLMASTRREMTYADRAKALATISDSYLKLVHAFKTDAKMWARAQTELVPLLRDVKDENSIDTAIDVLNSHLDSYLNSLSSWLSR